MYNEKLKDLISCIKAHMTFELAQACNGIVSYEFKEEHSRHDATALQYTGGAFKFKGYSNRGNQDSVIGSFDIGLQEKGQFGNNIPVVQYTCNSLWLEIFAPGILHRCLKKSVIASGLDEELKRYIKKCLIGFENQTCLVTLLDKLKRRYDLVALSGNTLFCDDVFNLEYMFKDPFGRTLMAGFKHKLPLELENNDNLNVEFTLTVISGANSATTSSSMTILPTEEGLGTFEEQLAADLSP